MMPPVVPSCGGSLELEFCLAKLHAFYPGPYLLLAFSYFNRSF
jgi:hypothetical protein